MHTGKSFLTPSLSIPVTYNVKQIEDKPVYSAAAGAQQTQTPGAVTGVEKTDAGMQAGKGYGARGGGVLVDISV